MIQSSQFSKKINSNELVPLNLFEDKFPIKVDIVYAQKDHPDNYFQQLYHPDCCIMWAHKDIALITLLAAKLANERHGWTIKIDDCLRPVEAQEAMEAYSTKIDPSLLSQPGQGAHPRAMAIDIEPMDQQGKLINMGTRFDHFTENVARDGNIAARDHMDFEKDKSINQLIINNRRNLQAVMVDAAQMTGMNILPLPQEWWDFRFHAEVWKDIAPLYEADLKPYQRMINPHIKSCHTILNKDQIHVIDHISESSKAITERIEEILS